MSLSLPVSPNNLSHLRKPYTDACLKGIYALVLEDDYSDANDLAIAITDAGAELLGPFSDEQAAIDSISDHAPHVAVVNLTAGQGRSLRLARALERRGIPFVFLTGHDHAEVPPDLAKVPLLHKTSGAEWLVAALLRRIEAMGPPRAAYRFL